MTVIFLSYFEMSNLFVCIFSHTIHVSVHMYVYMHVCMHIYMYLRFSANFSFNRGIYLNLGDIESGFYLRSANIIFLYDSFLLHLKILYFYDINFLWFLCICLFVNDKLRISIFSQF